jgi:hypothetical protein
MGIYLQDGIDVSRSQLILASVIQVLANGNILNEEVA